MCPDAVSLLDLLGGLGGNLGNNIFYPSFGNASICGIIYNFSEDFFCFVNISGGFQD